MITGAKIIPPFAALGRENKKERAGFPRPHTKNNFPEYFSLFFEVLLQPIIDIPQDDLKTGVVEDFVKIVLIYLQGFVG
jgi:hypothetical protein